MALDFTTIPPRVAALKKIPDDNLRGKALEGLVAEMLDALPGVKVIDRNVLSGFGEAEHDILLMNTGDEGGLPGFQRDVLVEVKSSAKALPTRDVEHFLRQIENRDLRWALLIALSGVSGDKENGRSGHHVLEHAAEHLHGVIVLVEKEITTIRSPEHLSAVIERKRQKMHWTYRGRTLTDEEIRALDPNQHKVTVLQGADAMRQAIRAAHQEATSEVFDTADQLSELPDDEARTARAEQSLSELQEEVENRRQNPDADPMWRDVRQRVLGVGAAFARLLDEDLDDSDTQRRLGFDVRVNAPQRLDATAGGELWNLLSDYRLRQIRGSSDSTRERQVIAMLSMVVDELIAIDDIDPRDVFGDYA